MRRTGEAQASADESYKHARSQQGDESAANGNMGTQQGSERREKPAERQPYADIKGDGQMVEGRLPARGDATTRLKTGDRVIVDGGQGAVHILHFTLQSEI